MNNRKRIILWFRKDLRLHDNEALMEALDAGAEIYPVFVFDDRWMNATSPNGFPRFSPFRKNYLIRSVQNLRENFKALGIDLIVRKGDSAEQVFRLARELRARFVFCNRERTTEEVDNQERLEKKLWTVGQELRYFRGKMLLYTFDLPFPVTHVPDNFNSFRKEVEQIVPIRQPLPSPKASEFPEWTAQPDSGSLPEVEPLPDGATDILVPKGGESISLDCLNKLTDELLTRDKSPEDDEPRLSPHLSMGCLSPKLVFHRLKDNYRGKDRDFYKKKVVEDLMIRDYLRLLGKKFGDIIFQKHGMNENEALNYKNDRASISQMLCGDAGDALFNAILNQLKHTGFIPGFARIYFARYIIDELGMDWRVGAELFESYLIDYDPCSNWCNWQILAGQGPEGVPEQKPSLEYLRKKLDPKQHYTEKWSQYGLSSVE